MEAKDTIVKAKKIVKRMINLWKIQSSVGTLRKFCNAYQGKRCFIVGNGPSLRSEDLDKLQGEICFATNRVYHIYDKVQWRPTFYCVQDYQLICASRQDINKVEAGQRFVALLPDENYPSINNACYIKLLLEPFYPNLPLFSNDVEKGIYESYTVSYMCLQLAIYMGFTEIYLLGIDHSYAIEMNPDGTIKVNEGVKNHFSDKDNIDNIPNTYMSTLGYVSAKKYADAHGIKIINATRGGKLEVFERCSFEDIL